MKKSVWFGMLLGLFCAVPLCAMNKGMKKVPSSDLASLKSKSTEYPEPVLPRPQINNYIPEETDSDSSMEKEEKTKKKRGLTRNNGSDDLKLLFGLNRVLDDDSSSDSD